MRKNLLYLVAFMCSISMSVMAQDSTACSATEVLLTMTDSYGDGWDSGTAVVSDAAGNELFSGTVDAQTATETLCLEDGMYAIIVGGSSYLNEMSFTIGSLSEGAGSYEFLVGDSLGCTNPVATNYVAVANIDDGSCLIEGCTDAAAFNFDADANVDDNSCEAVVLGCTDPTSLTWDPNANTDDESCTYIQCQGDESIFIFDAGNYGNEVSIGVFSSSGDTLLYFPYNTFSSNALSEPYDLCLSSEETYTLVYSDSYDDGWHGGSFSITSCDGLYTSITSTMENGDLETTETFSPNACADMVFGCMNSIAENYLISATNDDGSCEINGCLSPTTLEYLDVATFQADTLQCTEIVLGCTDALATNYDSLANSDDMSCVSCTEGQSLTAIEFSTAGSIYSWSFGTVYLDIYNEWLLTDLDGDTLASGNSGESLEACVSSCAILYTTGLFDSDYWNEDEEVVATIGDTSYTPVSGDVFSYGECDAYSGCTDPVALNFDTTAIFSLDVCEYETSLSCSDAISLSSGDVYPGVIGEQEWFTFDVDSTSLVSIALLTSSDMSSTLLNSCDGDTISADVLEEGTYFINVVKSFGQSNYDLSVSIDPAVVGCLDPVASNFNPDANIEDLSSCDYTCEGTRAVVSVFTGSYAGEVSWQLLNGAGQLILEVQEGDYSQNNITESTDTLCLNTDEAYTFNTYDSYGDGWNGGTYSITSSTCRDESYVLANNNGQVPNESSNGSAESSEVFTISSCEQTVFGCMDLTAFNYDSDATINDGCIDVSYGCTDASAANFDSSANTEDGSCVSSCTDVSVTIFGNPSIDSWTQFSVYSEEMSYFMDSTLDITADSVFTYVSDSVIDEVVGLVITIDTTLTISLDTLLVQTPDSALVQTVELTVSAADLSGSVYNSDTVCLAEGQYAFDAQSTSSFTSSWYSDSYSVNVICNDEAGSIANNQGVSPDPSGDYEYFLVMPCGSYDLGCTDSTALNYDLNASTDNGSCVPFIYGCTDSLAANYNADANTDDGLCADECLEVFVTIDGGYSVSSSNSWTVTNAANSVVANGGSVTSYDVVLDTLCLASGSYSFNSYSTSYYGDWSGDVYSVFIQCSDSLMNLSSIVFADNGGQSPEDSLSDPFAVVSCSDVVFGCRDSIAENYNADAGVDDGSCAYINGCTDATAANFDELATLDDASCTYACEGSQLIVDIFSANYPGEHTWELLDDAGEVLLSGGDPYLSEIPLCVPSGVEYTFDTFDSYGDGWDGATYAVYSVCDGNLLTVANNDGDVPSGSGSSEVFSALKCENITYGCADPDALNYDATVEYNVPGLCIAVVEGCTDASAANYNAAANTDNGSCVSACTDIAVTVFGGGGTIDSWTEFSLYAEEMTFFDDSTYVVDAVDTSYVVSLDSSLVDSVWAYSNDTSMVVSYDTTLVVTLDSALVQNVILSASVSDMYGSVDNGDVYSDIICIPEGSYVFNPSSTSSTTSSWYSDTFSVDAVCDDGTAILENNNGESPNPNGDNFTIEVVLCSAMTLGCNDSTAFNFDPTATHDNGSCVPTVLGCMDASAVNFNEDANVDDGLCADECIDISINVDGGDYGITTTNFWTVYNAADAVVASGSSDTYGVDNTSDAVCLPFGSYSFEAGSSSSTWGDDTYSIDLGCGGFDTAMVVSYDTALVVTIDSALVDSAWVFTSDSSEVVSVDTAMVVTDNTFVVVLASNGGESPAADATESFTVVSCDDVVFGCNDSIAENYNADATVNDGSCEFIFGCQIDYATNYDSTATVSNDSCSFDASLIAPADGVTLDLSDADSLTLSWEVALDLLGDTLESYYVFLSSNPNDLGSSDFTSDYDQFTGSVQYFLGSADTTSLVVQYADLYDWFISNGYVVNEVATLHWWVSEAVSYSDYNYIDGGYIYQYELNDQLFNSSHAINLTFTGVLGCTDATALNFNEDATVDNGSCILPCTAEQFAVNVVTSEGSYHSEHSWELIDVDGNEIATGGTPYSSEYPVCVESAELTFNTTDSYGDGWDGCRYEISLVCGDSEFVVANNGGEVPSGSGSTESFTISSCDSYVLGCTDPGYVEFNPLANTDDGSCSELACSGDVVTLNLYDSYGDGGGELTVGDVVLTNPGSQSSVELCVDLSACTEVSYAATDTWSSENSWDVTNANGVVLVSNGPSSGSIGTCAVLGCTDATADNYDADADEDDGSCIFYGCNNPIADNYDSDATDDDGSCILPCEDGFSQVDVSIITDDYSYQIDYTIEATDGSSYSVDLANNNNAVVNNRYCFANGSDVSFELNEDAYGILLGGYKIYVCGELEIVNLNVNEAGSYTEEFMVACGDITGCMDPSAINFNALASISDSASCEFPFICDGEVVEVSISTGSFSSEMDWSITDTAGIIVASNVDDYSDDSDYSTNVCLEAEAEFYFNAIDSYGDGWNGGSFVLNGSCGELASGTAADADVTSGSSEAFAFSTCAPTNEVTCQTIDLPQGWSMFSTSMMADDMDLATALGSIVDDVIIAKNNAGNAYLVEYSYNGVGDVLIGQGYQIKTTQATSFDMCGVHQLPEDNPIALSAGWNMVGYLRSAPADAAAVFADINANANLVIAKDYSGNAYLPEFSYNGIGDMHPGQGYQLKTVEADVLQYNADDASYRASNVEVINNTVSHFAKVAATDNNMTVVVEDAAWDVLPTTGAEIAAFDKAGNLIGSASYTSPLTVLTVWGDDATTEAKEGSILSETVTFKVWSNDLTSTFEVAKWTEGSANYDVNTINVAGAIVTNVLTSAIAVERELVKVINVLGQEVDSNERSFRGEVLFNVYNDGTVEKVVK